MLEEPGVDLHLPGEHRLELVVHVVPGRDLVVAFGELGVLWDHAELLLPGEGLLSDLVPPLIELAPVLSRPFFGHVVGGVGRSGCEVDEERLVRHQRLLLTDPLDGLVRHVLGEVVPVLGTAWGLDRHGVAVDRRVILVGLTPDETVEVLEPGAGGPLTEWAHRAGLPDRDFVTLAKLSRGIAVQQHRLCQRSRAVGDDRVVPGCRSGHLGDAAKTHGVMVAPGEQCSPRR